MENLNTIDIVIPSFRLAKEYILPLIHLPKPEGWAVSYYIVVDNPAVQVDEEIARLAAAGAITLLVNPKNLGASASRNKGLEAGNGTWILFLDDDVVAEDQLLAAYASAIAAKPQAIGFIGVTDFPQPVNHFTQAVESVGLTTIFKIAKFEKEFPWGVTANMMYRRDALGDMRFSEAFPKSGGGEDVDLPARMCFRHQARFQCLDNAKVTHPWWNTGATHYNRFVRYGVGTAYLLPRFKRFVWIGFPNPVESFVLAVILSPIMTYMLGWPATVTIVLAIPVFELLLQYIRAVAQGQYAIQVAWHMMLLRAAGDWGLLSGGFKQKPLGAFLQRINVDFAKPSHFRLNRYRIIKLVLFVALILLIWWGV